MFTIIRLLLHPHVYIISPKYHTSNSSKHHNQNFKKSSPIIESINHLVSQCKYLTTPQISPKSTSSYVKYHSSMLLCPPLKYPSSSKSVSNQKKKKKEVGWRQWGAGAHGCRPRETTKARRDTEFRKCGPNERNPRNQGVPDEPRTRTTIDGRENR